MFCGPGARGKLFRRNMGAAAVFTGIFKSGKRQGQRTDLTSNPLGRKLEEKESSEIIGKDGGDSQTEEKTNQVEQFMIPWNRIDKFFPAGTPAQKIEDTIVKALEMYRKQERARER